MSVVLPIVIGVTIVAAAVAVALDWAKTSDPHASKNTAMAEALNILAVIKGAIELGDMIEIKCVCTAKTIYFFVYQLLAMC